MTMKSKLSAFESTQGKASALMTCRSGDSGESRVDERFMVAVFVAGTELQMAVEKKAQIVLEAREHEMLVTSVAGKNDLVRVDVVFGSGGDLLRFGKPRA